ncbi:MAG: hypothetical protein MHPSP_003962, partial [Paramarteilia canceri]
LRFDLSLCGFKYRWIRNDHSLIIKKDNSNITITHLFHKTKEYYSKSTNSKSLSQILAKNETDEEAAKTYIAALAYEILKLPIVKFSTDVDSIVFEEKKSENSSFWGSIPIVGSLFGEKKYQDCRVI